MAQAQWNSHCGSEILTPWKADRFAHCALRSNGLINTL